MMMVVMRRGWIPLLAMVGEALPEEMAHREKPSKETLVFEDVEIATDEAWRAVSR